MARPKRMRPVVSVGTVLLAMGVALWASRVYPVGIYHDDGVYVILAKALATGRGFRYLHLPGVPVATHYPPVYPLFLAALWRLMPAFPANIRLFLLANVAFVGVAAWYSQRIGRDVLGWTPAGAAAAALVGTATFPMVLLSGLVLSETMFTAGLLATLVAGERLIAGGSRQTDAETSTASAIAMGIAAGLLGLIRAHALAVAVALVLLLALRRRRRAALACTAGTLLVLVPWALWAHLHATPLPSGLQGSYGTYGAWYLAGLRETGIAGVLRTVLANGREVAALLADRCSFTDGPWGRGLGAALAAAAIVVGAWRLARRAPLTVAFAGVYFAVLLLWPFTPWRFVYAVWPVVVLCAGAAIAWGVRLGGPKGLRGAAILLSALLLVAAGRCERRAFAGRTWATGTRQAAAAIGPLVRWVSANTTPSDVVAADDEPLVYLLTGRKAVPLVPFTASEYLNPPTTAQNARAIVALLRAVHLSDLVTVTPGLVEAVHDAAARAAADSLAVVTPFGPVGSGEAYRVHYF